MKHIIIPILLIASFTACNNAGSSTDQADANKIHEVDTNMHEHAETKPSFTHTVFFWMKEGLTNEEAKLFESELEILGTCPTIQSYKWGKPAGTQREVVDNSYTYAWILDFASVEDQDAYQVEPIHLAFIEKCKNLWTKVQVYDTLIQ